MKYIGYTMPLFKKAVKRNRPKIIHFQDFEFWFVTQKAVISYIEIDFRFMCELKRWIFGQHYKVEQDGKEFVKYDKC